MRQWHSGYKYWQSSDKFENYLALNVQSHLLLWLNNFAKKTAWKNVG